MDIRVEAAPPTGVNKRVETSKWIEVFEAMGGGQWISVALADLPGRMRKYKQVGAYVWASKHGVKVETKLGDDRPYLRLGVRKAA